MSIELATTYRLACPSCQSPSIRVDTMGSQISRLGIDPQTGQINEGSAVDFVPTDGPVKLYFCFGCGYENVVSTSFVTAD